MNAAAVAREADRLDRRGLARDLDALIARLALRGVAVSLEQRLRAEAFLHRLAGTGVDLGDRARLATWLTPLLAISPAGAAAIRAELSVDPAAAADSDSGLVRLVGVIAGARLRRLLLIVVAATALIAGGLWLLRAAVAPVVTAPAPAALGDATTDPSLPPSGDARHVLLRDRIAPGLMIVVPIGGLIAALLRRRQPREAGLRRATATGERFDSLPIPDTPTALYPAARARRAALQLKLPEACGAWRLDARATVRATVRQGGAPALRFRRDARVHEYVLLCERAGALDHLGLLADALMVHLTTAGVAVTRYDLDAGISFVRHAGGRRSGAPVERFETMRQRHAGARLIVLGGGETLARRLAPASTGETRTRRPAADGGAAAFGDLIADFAATPIVLDATPRERWGRAEAALQAAGLTLFPADIAGFAAAAALLGDIGAARETAPPTRIDDGEDALIALLDRDALRLCSNVAPAAVEVASLVRRLRAFLDDNDGFRLLAAIAAFPRVAPAITLHLCLKVNGRTLDAALAARLSRLPWLRAGRLPDWLRVAILRALPTTERQHVRERLMLVLDDMRAQRDGEPPALPRDDARRLAILRQPGVFAQLRARLGLSAGLVAGEGIFLRFLDGAPLDDLDQPLGEVAAPPGPWRIAAAAAAAAAGLAGVYWSPDLLAAMEPLRRAIGGAWQVILIAHGLFGIWLWRRFSMIGRQRWQRSGFGVQMLLHLSTFAVIPNIAEGNHGVAFGGIFVPFLATLAALMLLNIEVLMRSERIYCSTRLTYLSLSIDFVVLVFTNGLFGAAMAIFYTGLAGELLNAFRGLFAVSVLILVISYHLRELRGAISALLADFFARAIIAYIIAVAALIVVDNLPKFQGGNDSQYALFLAALIYLGTALSFHRGLLRPALLFAVLMVASAYALAVVGFAANALTVAVLTTVGATLSRLAVAPDWRAAPPSLRAD